MHDDERQACELIAGVRRGDAASLNQLLELIYPELKRRACWLMRKERPGHTFGPSGSELVQRVIEKILEAEGRVFSVVDTEKDVINLLTTHMRRLLVSYARSRQAGTRFSPRNRVQFDKIQAADPAVNFEEVLIKDDMLNKLALHNPQAAQAFELRFFGGLTNEEAAETMGLHVSKFRRELKCATVFLKTLLEQAS
jgi:RNA polymerase sigma factor (TIGR02999 family)